MCATLNLVKKSIQKIIKKLNEFLYNLKKQSICLPPGKEVILCIDQALNYDSFNQFGDLMNVMDTLRFFKGVHMRGDAVLKTWVTLKRQLERNPEIENLQIAEVNSDTVCGVFKLWMEHQYVPSATVAAGPKIKTLSFVDLTISDVAVFGSMLRAMVSKMPNLLNVDFSQTSLSAEQRELLRFQLEPLGRTDLLKF